MVLIEVVFETFEEGKLFIWTLATKYFRLAIGKDVFWSLKDLSMDDVVITTGLQQCFVTMDGCNNLGRNKFHVVMRICLNSILRMSMKLRNWEVFEMGFVTKRFIWKCVVL